MSPLKRAQIVYVQILSSYEAIALSTGLVPPITRIAWRHRHRPTGRVVIVGHIVWLTYHLLWEQE